MVLSDSTIRRRIKDGSITISPFDDRLIQPASIDLRLGKDFTTYAPKSGRPIIDPSGSYSSVEDDYERIVCDDNHPFFYLYPSRFVLGTTYETVKIPDDILARLEGKSSLGRIGLLVHITAGYIDPGFEGEITLELLNVTDKPIKLEPGMRIGQLSFELLDEPAARPYGSSGLGSHYQSQHGATPARFERDEDVEDA